MDKIRNLKVGQRLKIHGGQSKKTFTFTEEEINLMYLVLLKGYSGLSLGMQELYDIEYEKLKSKFYAESQIFLNEIPL